jgi:hypothetical protein
VPCIEFSRSPPPRLAHAGVGCTEAPFIWRSPASASCSCPATRGVHATACSGAALVRRLHRPRRLPPLCSRPGRASHHRAPGFHFCTSGACAGRSCHPPYARPQAWSVSAVPLFTAPPNWSLEADLHRHGAWAASRSGLCCASRPKRHPGSGPLSSNVRPHTTTVVAVPIFFAQFLVEQRNIWLSAEAPWPPREESLHNCVITQLFSSSDGESAYKQALKILAGLDDAHCDGPGDRTELKGVALLELDVVNLFGRSVEEQLAEPYGIDAGQVSLVSSQPKPKGKHELAVFAMSDLADG